MSILPMVVLDRTVNYIKSRKKTILTKLLLLLCSILSLLSPSPLKAVNNYPSKEIKIICPWAPGGGSDKIARKIADLLEAEIGSPVSVVNRTGGSGVAGFIAGVSAEPDGHTITLITAEIGTLYWTGVTNIRYRSFTNIAVFNIDPAAIFVRADSKWRTIDELQEAIIAKPRKLVASGTAKGGIWDLFRAGWLYESGIKENYLRWYPSNGAGPALKFLTAGQVDVVICSLPEAASLIKTGEIRALAVMAQKKNYLYPKVPTLIEKGVNFTGYIFRGFAVPLETPADIVAKIENSFAKIINSYEFIDFMKVNGFGLTYLRGSRMNNFLEERERTFGMLIQQIGLIK